jgi:hypothetical protein
MSHLALIAYLTNQGKFELTLVGKSLSTRVSQNQLTQTTAFRDAPASHIYHWETVGLHADMSLRIPVNQASWFW